MRAPLYIYREGRLYIYICILGGAEAAGICAGILLDLHMRAPYIYIEREKAAYIYIYIYAYWGAPWLQDICARILLDLLMRAPYIYREREDRLYIHICILGGAKSAGHMRRHPTRFTYAGPLYIYI
jgi:hypothetical protein